MSERSSGFIRELLSPLERELVGQLIAHPTYGRTPEQLFRSWELFVDRVEGGFDDIVDEYVYGLTNRDLLEDVTALVAPVRQGSMVSALNPLDLRFYDATEGLATPIYRREQRPPRWWSFRLPLERGSMFVAHVLQWTYARSFDELRGRPPSLEEIEAPP